METARIDRTAVPATKRRGRPTLRVVGNRLAHIVKKCAKAGNPYDDSLAHERIARGAYNMMFKPWYSLRSCHSDAALHSPVVNGFAIFSQLVRSVLRRLTWCYAPSQLSLLN